MGKRETADEQRNERVCQLSAVGDGFQTLPRTHGEYYWFEDTCFVEYGYSYLCDVTPHGARGE